MEERYGVLIVQLGTPASPAVKDVRYFLKKFLGDPRLVSGAFWWKIILNLFILPTRPRVVAKAYQKIWDGTEFPLIKHTRNYSEKLQEELHHRGMDHVHVRWAMMIGKPHIADELQALYDAGCTRIRVIPQYPQISEATTYSAWDCLDEALKHAPLPSGVKLERVQGFTTNPAYIDALVALCQKSIDEQKPEKLVLSFHGYPTQRIVEGDPYMCECCKTSHAMVNRLKGIAAEDIILCFQSKFGRDQWLEPSTENELTRLGQEGIKNVVVACPAFTVDCLETDEEIAIGAKETFEEAGGEIYSKVDAPNDDLDWVKGTIDELILPPLDDIKSLKETSPLHVPKQTLKVPPLSLEAKSSLKSVFMVLFIDLIGFSIIFPLFPSMLEYYGEQNSGGLYGVILSVVHGIEMVMGGSSGYHAVLFGGILGSIYSILQFLCAPLIGRLSDNYGRRPILIMCLFGIAISYGLWFFAGSFTLLVFSRLIGGVMSGNISTATAVVADVTTPANRSKGMAFVGIAFGLGFVIGPAVGAISTMLDLTAIWPSLAEHGINPFSVPALIAFCLAVANLWMVCKNFKESLPPHKRGKTKAQRSINPRDLFKVEQFEGVSLNNKIYFMFLLAFSGMEFTLTFLTFDRLGYNNLNQGMMFVFIGFVLVMMQGGYVRRKAPQVGERNMVMRGLATLIPGLAILGLAESSGMLYLGLLLMSMGSAQVIPCLTALASQYAPEEEQGRIVGVFRSLGALARAIGPLAACLIYWRLGATAFYILGASFVIYPLILVRKLPKPSGSIA